MEKKIFLFILEFFFVFAGIYFLSEFLIAPIFSFMIKGDGDIYAFKKTFIITFMFLFLLVRMWNIFKDSENFS